MKVGILFFAFLLVHVVYSFDHTIVTPKGLRVDAEGEFGFLNLHGYTTATVSYYLQNLPGKESTFSSHNGIVLPNKTICQQPLRLDLRVASGDIRVFRQRQTVLLTVQVTNSASDFKDTVEVFVSKKSGYIFLATDRPIYKPGEKVKIRAFPLMQSMSPSTQHLEIIVQTPDGIGVDRESRTLPQTKTIEIHFELPPRPMIGKWIVLAKYEEKGITTTSSTNFMVQRYVLPSFQVTIESKPFLLSTDETIDGKIKASYSYGEKVSGNYLLIMQLRKTPESIPIEFYKKPGRQFNKAFIAYGEQSFSVSTDYVKNLLVEGETLSFLSSQGATISIAATVTGEADGILESGVSGDIPIVTSPYAISTYRFVKYYTPQLSYVLQLDILDAVRKTPVDGVETRIEVAGHNRVYTRTSNVKGQINFKLEFISTEDQTITVSTITEGINEANQASITLPVLPYYSKSKSYLQITADKSNIKKGQQLQVTFFYFPMPPPAEIRYFVVSRGVIVHAGLVEPQPVNQQVTAIFEVTMDMIPSARVVGYYLKGTEVVSASMWFNVANECKTELTVGVPEEVLPGADIDFTLTGPPNAVVTLIGADRAAYFLYNGSRLSRDKMFDKMQSYDQACLRSNGKNGLDVFTGAGLLLESANHDAIRTLTLACPDESAGRKKREATLELTREKRNADKVKESKLKECEKNGKITSIADESCEGRYQRCLTNREPITPGCCQLFRSACHNATRDRILADRSSFGRSLDNAVAEDRAAGASIRSDFKESLIFESTTLNELGEQSLQTASRHSITTYDIDAVSMVDGNDGFCIAKTASVRTFKKVFVQLYTPYSLKKREQANLRIAVFNYDKEKGIAVRLEVKPGEDLCTHYPKNVWTPMLNLGVDSGSASSARLTVLPLRVPQRKYIPIQVRIKNNEGAVLDHVEKEILIEENGEIKDVTGSYPIDLKRDRRDSFRMYFEFPELIIPGSRQCTIFAYTNFLGPSIEVDPLTKEPRSLESIFRQPYGCGEQNMLVAGPNTYLHNYLAATKKISIGTPKWTQSVKRMKDGFKRQVSHRTTLVPSRPWSVYKNHEPSVWLNAYVNKVFSKTKEFYTDMVVDPVCNSYEWLLTKQHANNYFEETRHVYHREMHGAVGGKLTLTAYVVVSLLESQSICLTSLHIRMQQAAARSIQYLEANKNDATFQRPYGAALLTYALSLNQREGLFTLEMNQRLLQLKTVSPNGKHVFWKARSPAEIAGTDLHAYWYKLKPLAVDIEATSYALMAQIEIAQGHVPARQADLDFIRKIAMWLISQRNDGGAFMSTQDTVIGLQALSAYQLWVSSVDSPNLINAIDIRLTGQADTSWAPGSENTFSINNDNEGYPKKIEVPKDVLESEMVSVNVEGIGEGVMTYRCTFRTETEEDACHFNVSADLTIVNEEAHADGASMIVKMTITVSKSVGEPSGVSIIDIGLMSGFKPVVDTLERIAIPMAADGLLDLYQVTKQNVVLYLGKITHEPQVIAFHMEQEVPIIQPHPAKINVYDYYEPAVRCGLFYSLPGQLTHLRTSECTDEVCRCAEGGCPKCRTRDQQLNTASCLGLAPGSTCFSCKDGNNCEDSEDISDAACKSTFAFIIQVTVPPPANSSDTFVEFQGTIIQALKRGRDVNVRSSSNRTFVTRSDCYRKCQDEDLGQLGRKDGNTHMLKEGVDLFVYGNIQDKYKTKTGEFSEKYQLNEDSMVDLYFTTEACAKFKKRSKAKKLKCRDLNKKRTPEQEAKCGDLRKRLAACKNMEEIVNKLKYECD